MNARNLKYIRGANSRKAVQLANNKLETKNTLIKVGLPVANLYGIIHNRKELLAFNWLGLPKSFVIKPNQGLGGSGVMLIFGQKRIGTWIGHKNTTVTIPDLIGHVSNILDGNFSLTSIPDIAFFEERLKLNPIFKTISWQGIPDIRILIFNNVPIMAMLRLPTQESHGKANLHQGGIGVGLDLATGTTTYASHHDKFITKHPDTQNNLQGFVIPEWDKILYMAIAAHQAIGLGYSGVDIVIDRDKGPVILEINGHPGLSIQNANLIPLKERLDRVLDLDITTPAKGIKVAKELFAVKLPQKISADEETKPIIGFMEYATIVLPNNQREKIRAKIDTGLISTTMNRELAVKLNFLPAIIAFDKMVANEIITEDKADEIEERMNKINDESKTNISQIVAVQKGIGYVLRPRVKLSFWIKNKLIDTEVAISRKEEISYPFVVGRRDLKNFLVDASKSLTE